MVTPFVAGSLGLLLAAVPDATGAQAVSALEGTAGPQCTDGTADGLIHLDAALAALLAGPPTPNPTPTPMPSPTPTASPTPTPSPTPVPPPAPVVAPAVLTRSASLATVPKALTVLARYGDGHIALSNPGRAYLVVTLKRGGAVVWRGSTRLRSIRWLFHLRTASYTVTVSRPGWRVARGTVSFDYHRR